jgi:predicted nucleotidyltransferase
LVTADFGGAGYHREHAMERHLDNLLAELRCRLKAVYGERLSQLVLFGSQARGDAEPGSDVDILVVLQGAVDPGEEIARTGAITAPLSLRHDAVISCTFVSAARFASEQSPLFLNARREGVLV